MNKLGIDKTVVVLLITVLVMLMLDAILAFAHRRHIINVLESRETCVTYYREKRDEVKSRQAR